MYYKLDSEFPMSDEGVYFDIDDGVSIEGVRSWASGEVLPQRRGPTAGSVLTFQHF